METGWLKDSQGNKFTPKTMLSQIYNDDGITWKIYNGTSWENSDSGMTYEAISTITLDRWNEVSSNIDLFKMKIMLDSADDIVENVTVNYNVDVNQAI